MNYKTLYNTLIPASLLIFSHDSFAEEALSYCQAEYIPLTNQNKLSLVKDNFLFLEGPTWSEKHHVFYFSEMDFTGSQKLGPKATIYQLALPNHVSIYKKDAGTNGLLSVDDFLYTMNHKTRSLSRIMTLSGANEVIVNSYQGLKFNSPNDLVLSNRGTIYFTDPDWQLSGRTQETPYTGVYSLSAKGELTLVDKSLEKPNGIALSPDQKTLYVGSFDHEIVKYPIDKQGNIGDKEAFITINSPDGMAVDCIGNIYATSHNEGAIYIYSSEGEQIDKIFVGPKVTNITFGGEHLKTLLITTARGLYTFNANMTGLITSMKNEK